MASRDEYYLELLANNLKILEKLEIIRADINKKYSGRVGKSFESMLNELTNYIDRYRKNNFVDSNVIMETWTNKVFPTAHTRTNPYGTLDDLVKQETNLNNDIDKIKEILDEGKNLLHSFDRISKITEKRYPISKQQIQDNISKCEDNRSELEKINRYLAEWRGCCDPNGAEYREYSDFMKEIESVFRNNDMHLEFWSSMKDNEQYLMGNNPNMVLKNLKNRQDKIHNQIKQFKNWIIERNNQKWVEENVGKPILTTRPLSQSSSESNVSNPSLNDNKMIPLEQIPPRTKSLFVKIDYDLNLLEKKCEEYELKYKELTELKGSEISEVKSKFEKPERIKNELVDVKAKVTYYKNNINNIDLVELRKERTKIIKWIDENAGIIEDNLKTIGSLSKDRKDIKVDNETINLYYNLEEGDDLHRRPSSTNDASPSFRTFNSNYSSSRGQGKK